MECTKPRDGKDKECLLSALIFLSQKTNGTNLQVLNANCTIRVLYYVVSFSTSSIPFIGALILQILNGLYANWTIPSSSDD